MPTADLSEVSLHYRIHGEGPAVLGVMGFSLDQRFWAAQIPAVSATHSFITFDHAGIGRSRGRTPTSIEDMATDAVALLDHLGIERAVVFGASMGGTVAQHLALDHPGRVSALILALTWARPIEFMRRQHALARLLLECGGASALVDASLVRMFSPRFFEVGAPVIDQLVGTLYAESAPELPSQGVLAAQIDALDRHDVLDRLGTISCPTLVIGARNDVMVPGFASEEIAGAIPRARLVMLETGHGCIVEEMDAFNAALTGFLSSPSGEVL